MQQNDETKPSPHQVRLISAVACVHGDTVRRYFSGARSTSSTRARIEAAIVRLGMEHLIGRALDRESNGVGMDRLLVGDAIGKAGQ